MAHEDQSAALDQLLQLLSDQGFDGLAEAIEILMNEAMKVGDVTSIVPDLQSDALGRPSDRVSLIDTVGRST